MKTFRAVATVAVFSVASISVAMPAGQKGPKAPRVSVQAPNGGAKAPRATPTPKSGKANAPARKAGSTPTTPDAPNVNPAADAPPPVATNAISTKISGKPEQLARVQTMLPEGMTLEQATAGFRNQGQFIAALNASKNRGVSFADLQKAMTVDGLSLGQAVKKLTSTPPPAPATPPPGDSL